MFDFAVDVEYDGDSLTLTVGPPVDPHPTSTGRPSAITSARYSVGARIPTPDGEDAYAEPIELTVAGLTATGPARGDCGHLYVEVVDRDGRSAATYLQADGPDGKT